MGKKKKKLPSGWVCPVCGAVWSPAILRCLRFHGDEIDVGNQLGGIRKVRIEKFGSV